MVEYTDVRQGPLVSFRLELVVEVGEGPDAQVLRFRDASDVVGFANMLKTGGCEILTRAGLWDLAERPTTFPQNGGLEDRP